MSDHAARAAPGSQPSPPDPGRLAAGLPELVAEHHERLYRYAYRLCGSAADAEDLVQQVFLIAHQKLSQVRDAESVRPWLHTVLRNCYFKGRQKALRLPVAELDVNTLPSEPPEAAIDGEALQAAINTLDDEFKLVVLMFYFEQRSYREIAEECGIPLGTVMSRLSRAKAYLRQRLSERSESNTRVEDPASNAHPLAGPLMYHPPATRP